MEKAKLIVDLIGKLIWPVVVMTVILIFRKHITKMLPHIKSVKAAGLEFTIDKIEGIVEETIENKLNQLDTPEKLRKIIYQTTDNENTNEDTDLNDMGNSTMLTFTANRSFSENLSYRVYYDPATRNHNFPFKYIGLYRNGEIQAVGKLLKKVYCNYENGVLVPTNGDNLNRLTEDEYNRIKNVIEKTDYYEIDTGCKFFLVDNFYPTHYIKSSNYPLRAKKYFWLDEIEGFKEGMRADRLAELLNGKEWE